MRSVCWCVVAAFAGPLCSAGARAETEAEYAAPRPAGARSPAPPPRTTPRHMFAPAAAASARRLSPHEREERRFLREAAAASRFQAEAARLVLAKSTDPGVRSFAATLASHHSASGDDLLRMLHRRGMAAPMLENSQRRTLTRLARLQGAKLDRTWVAEVAVQAQQETVSAYEQAGAAVQDPALRQWLAQGVPALRYHVASAERLAGAGAARAAGHSAAPRARRDQRVE
ncbi:DUF4142 domain-containing protein [Ramlibacter sp. RBP-2]|uniref:DUF4142 domain-containing protein n=1 Tax=Ramlibacter lithotrophicus TaxID=2606681 RepID=A0A7X6DF83_9BURK|nr:DUF4142 domain-containing protein [Ramlibacter lithotrophicus]NKE66028.1 DUF4142 domain-containing protein [Ramlibacter lithotrophicus]